MKKTFLYIVFILITSLCLGQNNYSSFVVSKDFEAIKRYLGDSIRSIDPIEGIYNVMLERKIASKQTWGDYSSKIKKNNYTYRCAIVKIGVNKYELVWDIEPNIYMPSIVIDFERIGETMMYNISSEFDNMTVSKLKQILSYLGDKTSYYSYKLNSDSELYQNRIKIESPYGFDFSTEVHYDYTQTVNVMGVDLDYGFILGALNHYSLVKEYPTKSQYEATAQSSGANGNSSFWTGSGYAIGNGYIVTNFHVVEDAKSIIVKGIKGNMNDGYTAELVATDKSNDLAVLKIKDSVFRGLGAVPYSISTRMADVGEDVFVLGYPLTQALGNEIKLTNGIVSSRTGFQGDVSTYQISAPVQPGNSGGPMFDSKGNVIGIVVAGVPGAENVGYAIKTSYLKILIESAGLNIKLPVKNTISSLSLAEKVKRVKNFVYYIECSR